MAQRPTKAWSPAGKRVATATASTTTTATPPPQPPSRTSPKPQSTGATNRPASPSPPRRTLVERQSAASAAASAALALRSPPTVGTTSAAESVSGSGGRGVRSGAERIRSAGIQSPAPTVTSQRRAANAAANAAAAAASATATSTAAPALHANRKGLVSLVLLDSLAPPPFEFVHTTANTPLYKPPQLCTPHAAVGLARLPLRAGGGEDDAIGITDDDAVIAATSASALAPASAAALRSDAKTSAPVATAVARKTHHAAAASGAPDVSRRLTLGGRVSAALAHAQRALKALGTNSAWYNALVVRVRALFAGAAATTTGDDFVSRFLQLYDEQQQPDATAVAVAPDADVGSGAADDDDEDGDAHDGHRDGDGDDDDDNGVWNGAAAALHRDAKAVGALALAPAFDMSPSASQVHTASPTVCNSTSVGNIKSMAFLHSEQLQRAVEQTTATRRVTAQRHQLVLLTMLNALQQQTAVSDADARAILVRIGRAVGFPRPRFPRTFRWHLSRFVPSQTDGKGAAAGGSVAPFPFRSRWASFLADHHATPADWRLVRGRYAYFARQPIARGRHSTVYFGVDSRGTPVAVKRVSADFTPRLTDAVAGALLGVGTAAAADTGSSGGGTRMGEPRPGCVRVLDVYLPIVNVRGVDRCAFVVTELAEASLHALVLAPQDGNHNSASPASVCSAQYEAVLASALPAQTGRASLTATAAPSSPSRESKTRQSAADHQRVVNAVEQAHATLTRHTARALLASVAAATARTGLESAGQQGHNNRRRRPMTPWSVHLTLHGGRPVWSFASVTDAVADTAGPSTGPVDTQSAAPVAAAAAAADNGDGEAVIDDVDDDDDDALPADLLPTPWLEPAAVVLWLASRGRVFGGDTTAEWQLNMLAASRAAAGDGASSTTTTADAWRQHLPPTDSIAQLFARGSVLHRGWTADRKLTRADVLHHAAALLWTAADQLMVVSALAVAIDELEGESKATTAAGQAQAPPLGVQLTRAFVSSRDGGGGGVTLPWSVPVVAAAASSDRNNTNADTGPFLGWVRALPPDAAAAAGVESTTANGLLHAIAAVYRQRMRTATARATTAAFAGRKGPSASKAAAATSATVDAVPAVAAAVLHRRCARVVMDAVALQFPTVLEWAVRWVRTSRVAHAAGVPVRLAQLLPARLHTALCAAL